MNIFVLNTVGIGEDTIELVSREIEIKGIIGLSQREATDKISDYSFQSDFSKKMGFDFVEVESYGLSDEKDKARLLALDIDVLIVTGWQRLVPEWLIEHCNVCVIGSHGSPLGITKGRGRSPQNWALIMGMDSFEISIFQIDKGIDSGRVFASRKFEYSAFDDIKTSYYKVVLLTAGMMIDLLKTPDFIRKEYEEQVDEEAEYFPQRTSADGNIDWNCSTDQIRNLIRALTRPYPGATSSFSGNTIKIWDAIPFEINIPSEKYKAGEIVEIFNKQDILVRTGEGFILIQDYELNGDNTQLKAGLIFDSSDFTETMNVIIDRHEQKYEDLPVSTVIKAFGRKTE